MLAMLNAIEGAARRAASLSAKPEASRKTIRPRWSTPTEIPMFCCRDWNSVTTQRNASRESAHSSAGAVRTAVRGFAVAGTAGGACAGTHAAKVAYASMMEGHNAHARYRSIDRVSRKEGRSIERRLAASSRAQMLLMAWRHGASSGDESSASRRWRREQLWMAFHKLPAIVTLLPDVHRITADRGATARRMDHERPPGHGDFT